MVASGAFDCTFARGNYTDISFGKTFIGFPVVFTGVVEMTGDFSHNAYSGCAADNLRNVSNLSATGCRIWHERHDNDRNAAAIAWIAYGYLLN